MKIATWNINGVKARIDTLLAWLGEAKPDVACLQEIKSVDEGFPVEAIESAGYNCAVHGQKGFNGVALLSKRPLEDVMRGLPGDDGDEQARYVEATVSHARGALRIGGLYLPNGNPMGTEKFDYKCAWMGRLLAHTRTLAALDQPFVLAGDYNIIPDPIDAKRPSDWVGDALYQPASRSAYRELIGLGLTDALRACHPGNGVYTFWDYQAGAWQKDNGIRIDHMLLSPHVADRLISANVDRFTRGWEKPSDHAPVWVELDFD